MTFLYMFICMLVGVWSMNHLVPLPRIYTHEHSKNYVVYHKLPAMGACLSPVHPHSASSPPQVKVFFSVTRRGIAVVECLVYKNVSVCGSEASTLYIYRGHNRGGRRSKTLSSLESN